MMADLTPKVISSTDTIIYERGSEKSRAVTRTRYMLGELGPFTVDIDVDRFTDSTLRDAMLEKQRALQPHVGY
jgi:hypothetical protein